MTDETLVAMAARHVREGEAHVMQQHALIERLGVAQLPIEAAVQLLRTFEASLVQYQVHLDTIAHEQQIGKRDEDGRPVAHDAQRPPSWGR